MSHRTNLNATMARNSNRGIVTMSTRNNRSGTLRIKSGLRRSALSQRSSDSLVQPSNDASNQFYDKNLGKAFDRFK